MTENTNGQWRLRTRPHGMVKESDFELVREPIPELEEGQVHVRNHYLAFEPAMRGWLDDVPSYLPPVGIGEVMRASTVGKVIASKHSGFEVGETVSGMLGWQEHAIVEGDPGPMGGLSRVPAGVPPQIMLGALGVTGLTAYFGMTEVGGVKEGDKVLVSGAAGATGSVAAQIAKRRGASKVVGIAGGPEKCAWLTEKAGLDAAIDYKSEDVHSRLGEEFPDGVDLFFDNVGGPILDDALQNMAWFGRVVLCGGISGYNEEQLPPGPRHYMQIVIRRLTVKGFILLDHIARAGEAMGELSGWIKNGEIDYAEDVQEGFENAPSTLLRLYQGKNLGKQLLKIID
ncbi:MAG: NADP-dependent oxidoreductase [Myxococcota bacterium]|nr:NADP-dependent oxidoreductase [Deltaproteobacteria bacterium]